MKQEDVTAHCLFFPIKWSKLENASTPWRAPEPQKKKATLLKDVSKTERYNSREIMRYINEGHVLFKYKLEMLFQVWSVINYAL